MLEQRRYAIWGSAGHAKVLASLIALRGGTVVALFDQRDVRPALAGVPLHIGVDGFERWADAMRVMIDAYEAQTERMKVTGAPAPSPIQNPPIQTSGQATVPQPGQQPVL